METTVRVEAQVRQGIGGSWAKKLRREGKVPVVVYGGGKESVAVTVDRAALTAVVDRGHRLVSVKLGGEDFRVIVKEVQYDPLGDEIIHADFYRVVAGEKMKLTAELVLVGEAAGVKKGGIFEQPLRALDVECAAENLVELLEVDVSGLEIGHSLRVKDIKAPEGVKILNEPEAVVALITEAKEEVVAEVVEEAKEPELVGEAEKKAEAGEEEKEGEAEKK